MDTVDLRVIGCHYRLIAAIGTDQFFQLSQTLPQSVGVIKSALRDAVLHPLVARIVISGQSQSTSHTATDSHIDGIGSARDKGTGHFDRALLHIGRGFIPRNRSGAQEALVYVFSAIHPGPLALVLGNLFLAAAGDSIDVFGRAHDTADIHSPLVGGDLIIHRRRRNRYRGIVIDPRLEVSIQAGEAAGLVSARVESHIAAAFDGARHIYLALAIHDCLVLGNKNAGNAAHRGIGMGIQFMFVIGGQKDILLGGHLFIAESRTALYIHRIIDGDIVLSDRIRDSHRTATLGRRMVR